MTNGVEAEHDDCVVFIVDDDVAARESVAKMVREHGLSVQVFGSGQAFPERYDQETCGCVISDYRMPGMDGLRFQRMLADAGLPVVLDACVRFDANLAARRYSSDAAQPAMPCRPEERESPGAIAPRGVLP